MRKTFFQKISLTVMMLTLCVSAVYSQGGSYTIQPEDVLQITVYEHEDLTTRARVSNDGMIAFPLLGKVRVDGLTVSQIEEHLTWALEQDYLVSAQVQVFIDQYHNKQVSVLGAVNQPGKYDMSTEKTTTVLEAIAMAGGFTNVANANGTKVIRTQGEEEQSIPIRVTDITKKGMKDQDIAIEAGDIIFVPESFF